MPSTCRGHRSCAPALFKAGHKRDAPAMGGMSALIPIQNDPIANEKALAGNGYGRSAT